MEKLLPALTEHLKVSDAASNQKINHIFNELKVLNQNSNTHTSQLERMAVLMCGIVQALSKPITIPGPLQHL